MTMETPCNITKVRHSKASTLSEGDNNNINSNNHNSTSTNIKVRHSINVIEILEGENDSSKSDIYDAFDGEQLRIKKTITKKEEHKVLEEYKRRTLDENNVSTRGGKVSLHDDNINEQSNNDNDSDGDRGLFKGESIRKGIALNMDIVNQLLNRGDGKGNKECGVWEKIEEESSQRDCESYSTPKSDRKERVSRNMKRCDELSAMKKITEEKNAICEDGEEEGNEQGLGNESKERNGNENESGNAVGKKGNLKEDSRSGKDKDKDEWKIRKVRFKMKDEDVNDVSINEEHVEQHELQNNDDKGDSNITEGLAKEKCDLEQEENIQDNISIDSKNNKDTKCDGELKTHTDNVVNDNDNELGNKTGVIAVNSNEERETEIIKEEMDVDQEKETYDNQHDKIVINDKDRNCSSDNVNRPNEQIHESQDKAKPNADPITEQNESNNQQFTLTINEDMNLPQEYNDYTEIIREKNENIVDENEIQQHEELNTKSDIESYIELTKELNKRMHNNNDPNTNNKHFSNETSITKHNDNILPTQDKVVIESNVLEKESNANDNAFTKVNLSRANTNEHNEMKPNIEYDRMLNESHGNNHSKEHLQFNIEDGMNANDNNNEISQDINDHHHIHKSHLLSQTELPNIIHNDDDDIEQECKDRLTFKHANINKQQQLNHLSDNEKNDLHSNRRYYNSEPHVDDDKAVLNNFKQTITEENERIPTNATVDIKKTILTSIEENNDNNNDQEHQLLITPRKNISSKPKAPLFNNNVTPSSHNGNIQTPSKPLTEHNNNNPHPLIYKKQSSMSIKTEAKPMDKEKEDILKDLRVYNSEREHLIQEEVILDEKERNKYVFTTPGKQPNIELKKLNITNNNTINNINNVNNNSSSRFPSPRNESVLIESIATPKKQSQIIYKRSPINKDSSKLKLTSSDNEIAVSPNKNHKTEIPIKEEFNNSSLKKHSPKQPNTIPSSIIIPLCTNKELTSSIPKQLLLKQMKKDKEISNITSNPNEKIIKLNKYNSQTITNHNNIDSNQLIKQQQQQQDLLISRIQPVTIISKCKTQQHSPKRVCYLTSNINSPLDMDTNHEHINNNDANHFIPVSKKYSFIQPTNTITTNDHTSRRHYYNKTQSFPTHSQLATITYNNTLSVPNNTQSTIDRADTFTISGTNPVTKSKQGQLYSRNNAHRFMHKDMQSNTNSKATQTEMFPLSEIRNLKASYINNTRLQKYKALTVNNSNDPSRNNLSFYKCNQTHRGRMPMTFKKDNEIRTNYISHTSLISQRSLDTDKTYSYSYNYTEKPFYTIQKDSTIQERYNEMSKKGTCSKFRNGNMLVHHVNTNSMKRGKDEVSKYKYQITINEEDCVFD